MPETITSRPYTRNDGTQSREIYSECGDQKYRYLLELIWDTNLNPDMLMLVMSHPSTATLISNNDDYTVEICERFAKLYTDVFDELAFGGIYVTNIFPFAPIGQNPLLGVDDLIITENDRIIREYAETEQTTIICAWGNNWFPERRNHIEAILREGGRTLNCFGQKPNGNPKHPLELVGNVADINDDIISALDFMEWPADR